MLPKVRSGITDSSLMYINGDNLNSKTNFVKVGSMLLTFLLVSVFILLLQLSPQTFSLRFLSLYLPRPHS